MIILNMNGCLYQTETEIAYLGKLISEIFWEISGGRDPRNGIWNCPIGL